MEKQSLLGQAPIPHRAAEHQRKPSKMALFIAVIGFWAFSSWRFFNVDSNTGRREIETEWRTYAGESLKWRLCGDITGHDLECGTIDVPMDQFNSTNSGDKTFQIPLVRLRGKAATKNILLNPGGPGASGTSFVFGVGEKFNSLLGEDFHLVGFDPRGVNSSVPRASCYSDNESRSELAVRRTTDPIRDSPYLYAWAASFIRGCEENGGEHFKYINTPQTAADMNSIIDALGQQDMYYWGISYGSLLGQVYATLFPERSHRVIIDAVMDQAESFGDGMDAAHFKDNDVVLDGFFEQCVQAGRSCPLSQYGKTSQELRENVTSVIDSLRSRPASVYVDRSTYGVLDDEQVWLEGVFKAIYRPVAWPELAKNLAELQAGNATSAFLAYGQNSLTSPIPDANLAVLMNDAKTGREHWPQGRMDLMEKLLPFLDKYPFALGDMMNYYLKQRWDIPKTHSYEPQSNVTTAHPLLIFSTTMDPVCPYSNAQTAQKLFKGSRLVSIDAYGHSTLAMPSLCAAKMARNYFGTGALPAEEDTRCKAEGSYFPENTKALGSGEYTKDEVTVMTAQAALADYLSSIW